jgi:hypothetical protein
MSCTMQDLPCDVSASQHVMSELASLKAPDMPTMRDLDCLLFIWISHMQQQPAELLLPHMQCLCFALGLHRKK